MSKELTQKLDVDAIQSGGVNMEDQINKLIKFNGFVSLMKENNFDLTKVFPATLNDASKREIFAEMYGIVFNYRELTEDEWKAFSKMEVFVMHPTRIGELVN